MQKYEIKSFCIFAAIHLCHLLIDHYLTSYETFYYWVPSLLNPTYFLTVGLFSRIPYLMLRSERKKLYGMTEVRNLVVDRFLREGEGGHWQISSMQGGGKRNLSVVGIQKKNKDGDKFS